MSTPRINLVVVGHKDHGKSTLIGRLLYDSEAILKQKLDEIRTELKKSGKTKFAFAFLLDSLEEERKGGLTIDIMQTPFKSKKYLYTIIDCPRPQRIHQENAHRRISSRRSRTRSLSERRNTRPNSTTRFPD